MSKAQRSHEDRTPLPRRRYTAQFKAEAVDMVTQ